MRNTEKTKFIRFDSRKCKACWKCVAICTGKVFGKINIIIHKHAKIVNGDNCTGCLRCIKECGFGAIISLKKK